MSRFRHTGLRSTQLNISRNSAFLTSNNGLLIPAPMAHQNIVIMDVIECGCSASGKLGTGPNGGGVHLCNVNQGNNHLRAPIPVPNGQAVYTDMQGGEVTVTYAIGPHFSDTTGAGSGSQVGATTTTTTPAATTTTTTTTDAPGSMTMAWAAATSSITEAINNQVLYITVNRSDSTGTATVAYSTTDGTATGSGPERDYVPPSSNASISFQAGESSKTIAIEITAAIYGGWDEADELFTVTLSNATWSLGTVSLPSPTHTVTIVNLPAATTTTTSSAQECGVGYNCVCSVYACGMPYDWMNGEWVWFSTGIDSHPVYRIEDPNDSNQFGLLNWNSQNFPGGYGWNIFYDSWDAGTSAYTGKTNLHKNAPGGDCPYTGLADNRWVHDGNIFELSSINDTNITCQTTTTAAPAAETYFAWSTIVAQTLNEVAGADVVLTVTRSGNTSTAATVSYATADITAVAWADYIPASGTLSFAAGETSKTITVDAKGDTSINGDETFKVVLSSPTQVGGPASIIWPADEGGSCTGGNSCPNMPTAAENVITMIEAYEVTVGFTLSSSIVTTEGNSGSVAHSINVERDSDPTGVISGGTLTVDYTTSDGTATTANGDYDLVSSTLTFASGVANQVIAVNINGDGTFENNEYFNVTLSNPSINVSGVTAKIVGSAVHEVQITNDDFGGESTICVVGAVNSGSIDEDRVNGQYDREPSLEAGKVQYKKVDPNPVPPGGSGWIFWTTYGGGQWVIAHNTDANPTSWSWAYTSSEDVALPYDVAHANWTAVTAGSSGWLTPSDPLINDTLCTTTTTAAPAVMCVTGTGNSDIDGDWWLYTAGGGCNSQLEYFQNHRGGYTYYMSWDSSGGTWIIADVPCLGGGYIAEYVSDFVGTAGNPWTTAWTTEGIYVDSGACVPSNVCIVQSMNGYPYGDDFHPIPDWVLNTTWTPNGTTCHWMNAIEYTNNAPDGTTLYLSNSDWYDWWAISTSSCDDVLNDVVAVSDGTGDNSNPWGEAWTNAGFTVTELPNGKHCYPEGTANFCIDAPGYPSIDTTWVPYHTLTNQSTYPVWWNQYANGAALFMWHQHDISTQGWIITSDQWGDNTQNYWASSDDDAANPWSADWTSELDSIGASIGSGDCS